MYVILLLIFCVSCEFGQIHTGVSNQELLPREWNELVIFVNQKVGHFERLMNIKDGHIAQLKSELQNQNVEMMQLKQDVRLLQLVNSKHAGIQGQTTPTLESKSDVFANLEDINSSNLFTSRENTHRTKFIVNESLTSDKRHDYTNTSADGISILQRENIQNPHIAQLGTPSLDDYKPQWTSSKTFRHRRVHLKDTEVQGFQQKRVATGQTIAFHASLSHTVDASPHSTVVFDQEQLDQGDGYNPLDGIYSAPESGTYVITWTPWQIGMHHFSHS
ncbi:uncharacterized protein LOC117317741 [Pecten maximus]|uniref:uncharacterized protein LOC117317741 n=1 Tax=Pecten maximus TaxID=6579 RepID=UPI0014586166|nr:uncharacterized protein LOC117317741 [Pecten maximus]